MLSAFRYRLPQIEANLVDGLSAQTHTKGSDFFLAETYAPRAGREAVEGRPNSEKLVKNWLKFFTPTPAEGGYGGVRGTKICNFFGSHIWVLNYVFLDCVN